MITIQNSAGKVIHKSRNLRGINDYATKNCASSIILTELLDGGTEFFVQWENGSWAQTKFGSRFLCEKYAITKRFNSAPITIL